MAAIIIAIVYSKILHSRYNNGPFKLGMNNTYTERQEDWEEEAPEERLASWLKAWLSLKLLTTV